MNQASEDFKYGLYAADTTLLSTIQVLAITPLDVNNQLTKIYDWLAVNKLLLNIKKTKYIVFHAINKKHWRIDSWTANKWCNHRKSRKFSFPWVNF